MKAQRELGARVPDCALLDVNLGEHASFDLARKLRLQGIPFLFFTGYDASVIPAEFAHVPRLEKPVHNARLLEALDECCRAASVES